MKNYWLIGIVIASLTTSSCGAKVSTQTEGLTDAKSTSVYVEPQMTDTDVPEYEMPEKPDRNITELDGDLRFYKFDNDNATVVWDDKNVWIFDYKLDRVIPAFDHEAMLEEADIRGNGAKYFDDIEFDIECRQNQEYELQITYNVRSTEHEASYSVYGYYTLNSPHDDRYSRGDIRGYYVKEPAVYPGWDTPITITDIKDTALLGGSDDNYVVNLATAFATLDIPSMESQMGLSPGTLSTWESVKVSEYSISRTSFYDSDIYSLEVYMNIIESGVDRLPVGRYKFDIGEGMSYPNVEITSLDAPDAVRELNDAETFLEPWVTSYGGHHAIENMYTHDSSWWHSIVDFYLAHCSWEEKTPSYEDFQSFARIHFGMQISSYYVSRDEVENHGGHGLSFVLSEIVGDETFGNVHNITVNFYADLMKTVISRTYVFRLTETDGEYCIESCECTYNSGFRILSFGT